MPAAAPLTPEEARRLRAAMDWRALADRGAATPEDALYAEPEVAYAYAAGSWQVGDAATALAVAPRAEAEARRRGDRRLAADAVNLLGNALFTAGRPEEAEARFEALLAHASAWGDEELAARASNNLGVLANVRGRRDLALACYARALAAYQRLGNLRGLAQTHHNLAISYRDLGFAREADGHLRRAAELAERAGAEDVSGLAECTRGLLLVQTGDPRLGEKLAERARARFERMGDPVRRGEALRVLAAAARADGRDAEAGARLDEALAVARAHANTLLLAEVQRDRGVLLRDAGEPARARDALLDAAAAFAQLGAAAEAEAARLLADGLAPPLP